MWQARIASFTKNQEVLNVAVEFSSDASSFVRIYDMTGGVVDTLKEKINSTLATLEANDLLTSSLDTEVSKAELLQYVAPIEVQPMPLQPAPLI